MKTVRVSGFGEYDYRQEDHDHFDRDDADYGPSSPYESTIYLYNELTGEEVEPRVLVDFEVEPNTFYHGGVVINSVELAEDVSIGGKVYPAGTNVEQLAQFADMDIDEHFGNELTDDGLSVPVKNYPLTR